MTLEIESVKIERPAHPNEDCKNTMVRGIEDEPAEYILIVGLNENVLLDGSSMALVKNDGSCDNVDMVEDSFERRADKLYEAVFRIKDRQETGIYRVKLNDAETECPKDDGDAGDKCVCIVKSPDEKDKGTDCP